MLPVVMKCSVALTKSATVSSNLQVWGNRLTHTRTSPIFSTSVLSQMAQLKYKALSTLSVTPLEPWPWSTTPTRPTSSSLCQLGQLNQLALLHRLPLMQMLPANIEIFMQLQLQARHSTTITIRSHVLTSQCSKEVVLTTMAGLCSPATRWPCRSLPQSLLLCSQKLLGTKKRTLHSVRLSMEWVLNTTGHSLTLEARTRRKTLWSTQTSSSATAL